MRIIRLHSNKNRTDAHFCGKNWISHSNWTMVELCVTYDSRRTISNVFCIINKQCTEADCDEDGRVLLPSQECNWVSARFIDRWPLHLTTLLLLIVCVVCWRLLTCTACDVRLLPPLLLSMVLCPMLLCCAAIVGCCRYLHYRCCCCLFLLLLLSPLLLLLLYLQCHSQHRTRTSPESQWLSHSSFCLRFSF